MRKIFDRELIKLNEEMLQMGELVETTLKKSIDMIGHSDEEKFKEVEEYEKKIKEIDSTIQNHCLKLLIEHQPVASDLRHISSILKMITDMRRIGEQSTDIAEICVALNGGKHADMEHIKAMSKATLEIVSYAIDSFATRDVELAKTIGKKDDVIDDYFELIKNDLIEQVRSGANASDLSIDFIMIAKYLERTGDHAVNMARWVKFSIEG